MFCDGGRCTKGYHLHGSSKGKTTTKENTEPFVPQPMGQKKKTDTAKTIITDQNQKELHSQTLSFLELGMRRMFQKILTDMRPVLEQLRTGPVEGQQLTPTMVTSTPYITLVLMDPMEAFYQKLTGLLGV